MPIPRAVGVQPEVTGSPSRILDGNPPQFPLAPTAHCRRRHGEHCDERQRSEQDQPEADLAGQVTEAPKVLAEILVKQREGGDVGHQEDDESDRLAK